MRHISLVKGSPYKVSKLETTVTRNVFVVTPRGFHLLEMTGYETVLRLVDPLVGYLVGFSLLLLLVVFPSSLPRWLVYSVVVVVVTKRPTTPRRLERLRT